MQKIVISTEAPKHKRRARELFSTEFNYRPKSVESKRTYKRRPKHRNRED
jgi:hypothetical protein